VHLAPHEDALWLRDMLNREGRQFGTAVALLPDDSLKLNWDRSTAHGT
jgi:hypothetical protein